MKRVISIFIVLIVCTFSGFLLVGCSNNEIDKVSKNLTTYAIEATLNDEAKTLSASQSVDYLNCTGDTLEFLCFHLSKDRFRVMVPKNNSNRPGRLGGMAYQALNQVSFTHSSESSLSCKI